MLTKKSKSDQKNLCCSKTFKFLSRMRRSAPASPYVRMEYEEREIVDKKSKKAEERFSKDKENNNIFANKEVKEKKPKRKGWKRVRHAALMTCRYIGMGAAHMSPGMVYVPPEYYADPKYWNRSFSPSYKSKAQPQTQHWTSNMMFAGW